MTPLAYQVVNDMTRPRKRREFRDEGGILQYLRDEFHCFEVTAINRLAHEIRMEMWVTDRLPSFAWSFLPAPYTWIEYREQRPTDFIFTGARIAYLLVERPDGYADVYWVIDERRESKGHFGSHLVGRMALRPALERMADKLFTLRTLTVDDDLTNANKKPSELERLLFPEMKVPDAMIAFAWHSYAALLLINTPHVVNQTRHDPHRGLARTVKANKALGMFPLQAWTEIVLRPEITVTLKRETGDETGRTMPMHWTRAHARRDLNGIWRVVRDYWSGDASVGIKRSRYRIAAPQEER